MDEIPYQPPAAPPSTPGPTPGPALISTKQGQWFAILGITLFTGPIWGTLGTVIGMSRSFETLAQNEAASPQALSQDIKIALISTMLGISIGVIGAILTMIALFAKNNRQRWFLHWAVGLSVVWPIVLFPLGFIVALPVAFSFLKRRNEFKT